MVQIRRRSPVSAIRLLEAQRALGREFIPDHAQECLRVVVERGEPSTIEEIAEALRLRYYADTYNAFEVGRLYATAKRLLPHGSFDTWCRNLGLYSKQSICAKMRLYRRCLGRPELVQAIKPSLLEFLCSKKCPRRVREEVFSAGEFTGTLKDLKALAERVLAQGKDLGTVEVRQLVRTHVGRLHTSRVHEARTRAMRRLSRVADKTLRQLRAMQKLASADRDLAEAIDYVRRFVDELP